MTCISTVNFCVSVHVHVGLDKVDNGSLCRSVIAPTGYK